MMRGSITSFSPNCALGLNDVMTSQCDEDLPDFFDLNAVQWDNSPHCELCAADFSMFSTKRHHCRRCGKSVCIKCSTEKRRLCKLDHAKHRVCD